MNIQRPFALGRISLLPIFYPLFVLMLFAGGESLRAQSGSSEQWNVFPVSVPFDSLYSLFTISGSPFFRDPLHGYCRWNRSAFNDTTGNGFYTTTNGGEKWSRVYGPLPIPHEVQGQFGLAPTGEMSTDGGESWDSTFVDSAALFSLVHGPLTAQGFPQVMAGFIVKDVRRLVFTIDGGKRWRYADTVVPRRDPQDSTRTISALSDTTLFGVMPVDSATRQFRWETLLGIAGDTLYVTSRDVGRQELVARADHFNALNLRTLARRSTTMDTVDRRTLANLTRTSNGMLYMWNTGAGSPPYFLRSMKEGATWDSVGGLDWINFAGIRFLSPTYGISLNGLTTDAGATWRQWGNPWDFNVFYPLDSLHLFGMSGRIFLRSNDGGRSWNRAKNFWSISDIDTVYAWNKKVIAAAGTREILLSTDSGEIWTNLLDVSGALPVELKQVRAFVAPDPEREPNRLIALATCVTFDSGAPYACICESRDGGQAWGRRGRLPELDSNILATWSMQFVRNSSDGKSVGFLFGGGSPTLLYRSDDGGNSWEYVSTGTFTDIAMVNEQYGIGAREGALLRTTDGGSSWNVTKSYNVPLRYAYGLKAFDQDRFALILPNNLQTPYEWKPTHSTDGGSTWTMLRGQAFLDNDPGHLLWISPGEVYSASSLGILYSSDSGRHFTTLHTLLPSRYDAAGVAADNAYIYQFDKDSNRVGRWRIQDQASGVEEQDESRAVVGRLSITLLELPVREWLHFRYAVRDVVSVAAVLYDAWGREVMRIPAEQFAGEGAKELNVGELPSGFYFIRFSADGEEVVRSVQIVR